MLSYNLSFFCIPLSKTKPGARRSRVFKRGFAPLPNILPLPYQGRGIKRVPGKIKDFSGCLKGEGCQKTKKLQGQKGRSNCALLLQKVSNHSKELLGA